MADFPAFQFYARDWLASSTVNLMDRDVQSDFLRLLCYQSLDGCIPGDPEHVRRLLSRSDAEWPRVWSQLEPVWPVSGDGKRRNPRQTGVLDDRNEYHEQRSAAGKLGNEKRWGSRSLSDRSATVLRSQRESQKHRPASASSSAPASSSASAEVKGIAPAARARFEKPTLAELQTHLLERRKLGKPPVDPEAFIAHYESQGWMVGKRPMKDWKAAVVTWEKNSFGGGILPAPAASVSQTAKRLKVDPQDPRAAALLRNLEDHLS